MFLYLKTASRGFLFPQKTDPVTMQYNCLAQNSTIQFPTETYKYNSIGQIN